jgi:hypothetical protein
VPEIVAPPDGFVKETLGALLSGGGSGAGAGLDDDPLPVPPEEVLPPQAARVRAMQKTIKIERHAGCGCIDYLPAE